MSSTEFEKGSKANVSEVATFFGPPTSPLFGVLHLPADEQIRGGVIICSSLGKDGMDSVRLQRILANDLAERGFGVLRFDYLGTGDSAYVQNRDDAVHNWRRSVRYALEYLKEMGAQSITAIAFRAGSLIFGDVLARSHSVDVHRVVYFDPIGTGRRYLREQAALFVLSAGVDEVPEGTVSIIGARLSAHAAKEFAALRLDVDQPDVVDHLLVLRTGGLDAQVSDFCKHEGVESVTVGGLVEFAQPADTVVPMPLRAIDSVIAWVERSGSPIRTRATPRYITSARMPTEGPSDTVIESIESIEPGHLFAIRTRPEHSPPGEGTVVVFYSSSNDPHVGPAREWVELSRSIAQSGAQALRWDRSGVGQSGPISRQQWRPIYTRQDVVDAISVAEFAANSPRSLKLVGICSGSWYAAQVARAIGADAAILVNLLVWNWHISASYLWQWDRKRSLRAAAAYSGSDGGGRAEGLRQRVISYFMPAREVLPKLAHRYVPHFVLVLLGHLGLALVPEIVLAPLARAGTATTVLLSTRDAELFSSKGGYRALKQLDGVVVPPRSLTTQNGDHAAYRLRMLEAIRQTVMQSLS